MALLTSKRIAVLMGGHSAEREISLKTGRAVLAALIRKGYDAIPLDVDGSIAARLAKAKAQIAFISLHGPGGEDGTIQGLLEILQVPYTGSGVQACAMAMDKALTKTLLAHQGILVPAGVLYADRHPLTRLPGSLRLPVVVKPVSQGSTVGISIVRHARDLQSAIAAAQKFGPAILLEEYIEGRELTVGVVNDWALPVVEITAPNGFYDYRAKYTPGATTYQVPASLKARQTKLLQDIALHVHASLGCRGATRVDFRLDPKGKPFVLEINTVPGMTETSLLPMAAKAAGLPYASLVEAILQSAMDRTPKATLSRRRP